MDWARQTSYKVHEAGSTTVIDVAVRTEVRTKANIDRAIQAAFQTTAPIVALLREDRSRVDSDLSVVFLAQGALLEVYFGNKVRCCVSPSAFLCLLAGIMP